MPSREQILAWHDTLATGGTVDGNLYTATINRWMNGLGPDGGLGAVGRKAMDEVRAVLDHEDDVMPNMQERPERDRKIGNTDVEITDEMVERATDAVLAQNAPRPDGLGFKHTHYMARRLAKVALTAALHWKLPRAEDETNRRELTTEGENDGA